MIRFTVLYPEGDGATFDHDYYRQTHVPLACEAWGLEGAEIDKGISGPYLAGVHFTFESQDAMNAAMASERTGEVMADVANFTNAAPIIQTSEIVAPG